MSRKCELTGVGVLYGNKVSHSERKTRRRFEPNMRVVRFVSDVTGSQYKFRVNARCIRSVEKTGGFDEYMIKISENMLSDRAKLVKRKIITKKAEENL
ncbi:50S ribosomal protein L28 [Candidatus Trichorickettsia mobilis]|uniref:Large ribosomal subunit protein bL28 n=1 Tax=Candidatus Trichorickettsia mobilis TaxID=1346319 RepID=A0ABZ0UT90_9RICK|nr:50S ribosomal protein L28 [Candidatus Trichorickettsia mobilis]WPY00731.1 50S ribosomal protein L28 [Candidatus Trichorickettsia mobilis]